MGLAHGLALFWDGFAALFLVHLLDHGRTLWNIELEVVGRYVC